MSASIDDVLAGRARWALVHGDCDEVLTALPDSSIDAIVTDPPSGIGFMGKSWDRDKGGRDHWIAWLAGIMADALRALKPGGHALVWALPRTSHWTATAVENAGFEIRDVGIHLFGTGFPKSLNGAWGGTALKPAAEHWILARKPLIGTVAANVAAHGTGGLNIDACRIGTDTIQQNGRSASQSQSMSGPNQAEAPGRSWEGRWPAHVTLNEEAAAALDEQSGERKSGIAVLHNGGGGLIFGQAKGFAGQSRPDEGYSDSGGASRFFFTAKPSTSEREAGTEHLPKRAAAEMVDRDEDSAGTQSPRAGAGRTSEGRANFHPTVKPIDLMRWLCRLITPKGGVVFDPFAGSGTTGCAAMLEGFRFVGAEMTEEYLPIARARIAHWQREHEIETAQGLLFGKGAA